MQSPDQKLLFNNIELLITMKQFVRLIVVMLSVFRKMTSANELVIAAIFSQDMRIVRSLKTTYNVTHTDFWWSKAEKLPSNKQPAEVANMPQLP